MRLRKCSQQETRQADISSGVKDEHAIKKTCIEVF